MISTWRERAIKIKREWDLHEESVRSTFKDFEIYIESIRSTGKNSEILLKRGMDLHEMSITSSRRELVIYMKRSWDVQDESIWSTWRGVWDLHKEIMRSI